MQTGGPGGADRYVDRIADDIVDANRFGAAGQIRGERDDDASAGGKQDTCWLIADGDVRECVDGEPVAAKGDPSAFDRANRGNRGNGGTDCQTKSTLQLRSAFVEFHVPVQIVPPALRRSAQADLQGDTNRVRIRTLGDLDQMHARLSRSAPPLPAVAVHAAGHDVLPILPATLCHGNNMVERQLSTLKHLIAVLTRVSVTRVDVFAGERDVVEAALDLDETEEADDRWQLETDGHRPYLAVVDRDHLDLPLAPERDRLAPVNDLERLVRRVQKERLLHTEPMMQDARRAVKDPTWINPKQH